MYLCVFVDDLVFDEGWCEGGVGELFGVVEEGIGGEI